MNQNKDKIKKQINKLRGEINHHRYLYHVLDKPEISDGALDSLKNELFKLEMKYPEFITADSPTRRIGGKPLDKFRKVEHSSRMISLFDAFNSTDMRDWEERMRKILAVSGTPEEVLEPLHLSRINYGEAKRRQSPLRETLTEQNEAGVMNGEFRIKNNLRLGVDYYCELKLDGLAVSLRYEKGIFVLGATRGDGKVGEDVSGNLKTIESIPLRLRAPAENELKKIGLDDSQIKIFLEVIKNGNIEVRGEAIMAKKVLQELNEKYKKDGRPVLANPRNGAAGSIRQLDPKLAAERKLDFYVYDLLLSGNVKDIKLSRQEQRIETARLLGFRTIKHNQFCANLEEVEKFHSYWEEHRDKLPFEVDGVVVKVNNLALWPILGVVGKGPRYMMAYKFAAEQATTKVRDAIWQVGRTGALTPIAVLDPVKAGGVTINHASLHNMDEIKRLGLKIRDTVIIERAGDVIPKVVKVMLKLREGREKNIHAPQKCPMCGSAVEKIKDEVAYRCSNKNCYAVNLRRLIHWVSKGAMDIEGLGPKIIEQLIKEGLVSDISDFYNLTADDLRPLERFAEKSAENLIAAIKAKKEVDLARFIYGLGIRHVGEETATLLKQKFSIFNFQFSISGLIEFFNKNSKEDLEKIHDIGPIVAGSICGWFLDEDNIGLLKKLEKKGVAIRKQKNREMIKQKSKKAKKQEIEGKIFVLTGALSGLTRAEAKGKIRELGGRISSSVSKNTDYVIAGDNPGNKYKKALKLGVKILEEVEFLKMLN